MPPPLAAAPRLPVPSLAVAAARVRRLWLQLPLCATLVAVVAPPLLLLWGAIGYDMRTREAQLEAAYQNRISNVAQVSGRALEASIVAADQLLLDLREAWVREPERFDEGIDSRRSALDTDFHVSVIGPGGEVRYSHLHAAATGMPVGEFPHITVQGDTPSDTLHVGAPMRTRTTQPWLIPLSRRLPDGPDAAFTGVVVLWVPAAFLSRAYERTELHPGSVFTLVDRETGHVLLRSLQTKTPGAPAHSQDAHRAGPLQQVQHPTLQLPEPDLQHLRRLPPTGTGHWASPLDGVERNHAGYRFNDLPLLLVAGEPRRFFLGEATRDRRRHVWFGVLLSALFVLTTLGQLVHLRARVLAGREKERQLQHLQGQQGELERSRASLRELGQHLVTLRENERQRIAQDLHDDIGQQLSVLRLCASRLKSRLRETATLAPQLQPEADTAAMIQSQIDDTIATVRRIAEDLRPAALTVGLSAAVHSLCDELSASAGLECSVRDELAPDTRLSEPCATAVYRILQEAAANTLRHAKAQRLHVHLYRQGEQLLVDIRDDGVGISLPQEAERRHFGLMGMRERALALGGRLQVSSVPGGGTTVQVDIPLGACTQAPQPAAPLPLT